MALARVWCCSPLWVARTYINRNKWRKILHQKIRQFTRRGWEKCSILNPFSVCAPNEAYEFLFFAQTSQSAKRVSVSMEVEVCTLRRRRFPVQNVSCAPAMDKYIAMRGRITSAHTWCTIRVFFVYVRMQECIGSVGSQKFIEVDPLLARIYDSHPVERRMRWFFYCMNRGMVLSRNW